MTSTKQQQREALEGWFSASLDLSKAVEPLVSFRTFTFRERPWCEGCGELLRRSWREPKGKLIEETVGRLHRRGCPYRGVRGVKMVPPSNRLARGVMEQLIEAHLTKKPTPMVGCIEEGRVNGRWHLHVVSAPRQPKKAEWLDNRLLLHADRYGMVNTRRLQGRQGLIAYTLKHQSRLTAPGAWMVDRRHKVSSLDGGPALHPRRGTKGREPGSGHERLSQASPTGYGQPRKKYHLGEVELPLR